jgi:hypothetical protein
MDRFLPLLLLLVVPLAGCRKTGPPRGGIAETPLLPPAGPKVEACSLLTKEEVGAIQGGAMTEPQGSEGGQGEFWMTQCYYGSTAPDIAVSLAVIQRLPNNPAKRSVADYWHEIFADATKRENQETPEKEERQEKAARRGEGEKEEHEGVQPQKIDGLGEDAYWMGNPIGGILYVLKNDRMLRISVGGPDSAGKKLEKSKRLARKAIGRLPK